ncbi:ABC transporter permease [Myceligenerans pegani]|uniref:ABC transporter permease n=1 Tax=Myceligenerans pegani TaxID=2776917 RepID=A0ABR9N366_9MICO|nr:ABC transporter permease [Myceligenerans sp. TRM 65318]MBE1878097.1 ABC transporter permease [Myceligenerans sp. TRM 65318]MBE3020368.1 ABC transporter permease [Myceligenerans sp. TRM 65318]
MRAVLALAVGAALRRRLQGVVTATVVLLTSATTVLALALLLASAGPFERAFERQNGAHATAALDPARATSGDLTATGSASPVSAAAGPYPTAEITLEAGGTPLPPVMAAGRGQANPGVDDLAVVDGTWLTGPGQIVLSPGLLSGPTPPVVGDTVTVDLPGNPTLTVVGFANSITRSAGAWVWPTEEFLADGIDAATGGTTDGGTTENGPDDGTGSGSETVAVSYQMLYRFAAFDGEPFGGDADEAGVEAALADTVASLPDDALSGSSTHLAAQRSANAAIGTLVPFVVAFAALGLAMSVLVVANVVAGAVVAGRRATGIQRALGFSPAQVVAAVVVRMLLVAVPACLAGVGLGVAAAVPLLTATASAYAVPGSADLPVLAPAATLVAVPLAVAAAALVPAIRAGRLSPVRALTVGRAPAPGRRSRPRRAVASLPLPRPVALGLTSMFARPTRSATTLVALVFGATTAVLAIGLASSLSAFVAASDRIASSPVSVTLESFGGPAGPGGSGEPEGPPPGAETGAGSGTEVDVDGIIATILDEPGTAAAVGTSDVPGVTLVGSGEPLGIRVYHGDATWTGYPILSGRWYDDGEAVASSRMLRLTGTDVGDTVTLTGPSGTARVRIVGEAFANDTGGGATLLMSAAGVAPLAGDLEPRSVEVGLDPGTEPRAYVEGLATALSDTSARPAATADEQENSTVAIMTGLIALLATALCVGAALGVLNTVVLTTREQVQEIGVLKAIGMTPRQVRTMVVVSTVLVGLAAGLVAVPAGTALHSVVLPAMGAAAQSGLPASVLDVFRPAELAALGASGVVLAVLGALLPAGWAARTRPATALRTE